MIYTRHYKTPAGELILGSYDNQLCLCDWIQRKAREQVDKRLQQELNAPYQPGSSTVLEQAMAELDMYFERRLRQFNTALLPVGTDFQKRVWQQLLTIPYGQTASYAELAEKLGNPKVIRAAAAANGANPIAIFIPCHRVIGSDNKLVGYAGGLQTKQKLLEIEFDLAAQFSLT